MTLRIRPHEPEDHARLLDICLAAFEPVHRGFEKALGPEIFRLQYGDWRETYAKTLADIPNSAPRTQVFVAEEAGDLVGFVFTILDPDRELGEIGLNAVDPRRQGRGIGKTMYRFALRSLKERGAVFAYVATGGDAAHAPARAAYEAVGFDRAIPALHCFREL